MTTTHENAATRSARIEVRRMKFEFPSDLPEHWAANDAFLTALMAALSASFPAGERYFIDSVRHYAEQVDDPELKERVRGFIGQEANHTKEHLAFNRYLEAHGMPVLWIEERVEKILRDLRKRKTPAENLAHTVALEHLTAVLASAAFESPEAVLDKLPPKVAAFWGWHLIEEIEHRSVAFDVYQRCVGDDALRLRAMVVTTALFSAVNLVRTVRIMQSAKSLTVSNLAQGLSLLFGRRGVLTKMAPLYRAFYRRDFHPDQHDNMDKLAWAKSVYLPGQGHGAPSAAA